MQTIKIRTSQNIDIDYEVAGVGDRFVARLIDYGIFIAILILGLIVSSITAGKLGSEVVIIVIVIIYAVLFVFYDLACELLMNGQSIGKRVMKIKVISLNGNRASFGQYLLRWLFRIVDFTLTFQVCGLITAAVTDKSQRVGDIVAGTTLIRTQPRTKINHLAFTPVADNYQPVFTEVSQLTDRDVALLQEVIRNYIDTGNGYVVYNAALRIKDLLSITKPAGMDDMVFLQTLVKDYNHIIAQTEAT